MGVGESLTGSPKSSHKCEDIELCSGFCGKLRASEIPDRGTSTLRRLFFLHYRVYHYGIRIGPKQLQRTRGAKSASQDIREIKREQTSFDCDNFVDGFGGCARPEP